MLCGQIAQALPFLQADGHDLAFGRDHEGRLEQQQRRQGQSGKSLRRARRKSALLWLFNHAAAAIIHPLPGLLASPKLRGLVNSACGRLPGYAAARFAGGRT